MDVWITPRIESNFEFVLMIYFLDFYGVGYMDGGFRGSVGVGIPWGFPQVFFCGYGMGMGIEIQSPLQPFRLGGF